MKGTTQLKVSSFTAFCLRHHTNAAIVINVINPEAINTPINLSVTKIFSNFIWPWLLTLIHRKKIIKQVDINILFIF